MLNSILTFLMAIFFVIGILDKIFNNRWGYAEEFEKGLNSIGQLTLLMAGIMCIAPVLAKLLASLIEPYFFAIGSDPTLLTGIIFPVDAGGLPLAQSLAQHPEAVHLFGIGLGSTLACILTLPLPFSLNLVAPQEQRYVVQGLVCGIIASPFSLLAITVVEGYSWELMLRMNWPTWGITILLAISIIYFQKQTISFFVNFGKILMSLYAVLLALGTLQHFLGWTLINNMAPIEPQLSIIAQIGLMLAGAYPMILFVKRHLNKFIDKLSTYLNVDKIAVLGMLISLANPLPMYTQLKEMTPRGKVLSSAFAAPALCTLGDHLAFMSAYYPEGIRALLSGKLFSALIALFIAMLITK